jgi:hypothetical protein
MEALSCDIICFFPTDQDCCEHSPTLMSQAAKDRRVFCIETPKLHYAKPMLENAQDPSGVWHLTPYLTLGSRLEVQAEQLIDLLRQVFHYHRIRDYCLWAYSATALPTLIQTAQHCRRPVMVIYDCLERTSPLPESAEENALSIWADIIFTDSKDVYTAKRQWHTDVYFFPTLHKQVSAPSFAYIWRSMDRTFKRLLASKQKLYHSPQYKPGHYAKLQKPSHAPMTPYTNFARR